MQKRVIVEKMKDQSNRLKHLLTEFSSEDNHSVVEIEQILKETEQLSRILSAYRFLTEHKEISTDINVHMKIMDAVNKQEEAKAVPIAIGIKETIKQPEPIIKFVEVPVKPVEKVEEVSNSVPEKLVETTLKEDISDDSIDNSNLKKIEFGLNDKYRIINELFDHNNAEYTTAINQLNMTHSWEDAENYLDSLKSVYSWKSELPLVKMLYTITQKRFQ
ncbi:MAG: hypothetical protein Q8M29_06105 [Bacteroidota bacterium]|nr:hypothetical protein [Bacteroidota bacterium]